MASVEAMGSLAPLLEALRASSAWLRAAKVHGAVIGGRRVAALADDA